MKTYLALTVCVLLLALPPVHSSGNPRKRACPPSGVSGLLVAREPKRPPTVNHVHAENFGLNCADKWKDRALTLERLRLLSNHGIFAMGANGAVCYCSSNELAGPYSGAEFAVKILPLFKGDVDRTRAVLREVWATNQLSPFPHFPQYYGTRVEGYFAYMYMEYIPGLTLWELCTSPERTSLSTNDILEILIGIAEALVRIHGFDLVHGDLGAKNVMITPGSSPKFRVKLIDLGWIRRFGDSLPPIHFTNDYLDPRLRLGTEKAGPYMDVYSFAQICALICTGHYNGNISHFREDKLLKDLFKLLEYSRSENIEERPSALMILEALRLLYTELRVRPCSAYNIVDKGLSFSKEEEVNEWIKDHLPSEKVLDSEDLGGRICKLIEGINKVNQQ